MICAWQAFVNLLPVWMREAVDKQCKDDLQELRMRLNSPPELITSHRNFMLDRPVSVEDLQFSVNLATKYSPWSSGTVAKGFITAPGGHRIGLCGKAVVSNGQMCGIRIPSSLCLRIARDFPGIGEKASQYIGSILIIGRPGSGKTTLLRDIIRQRANKTGKCVAVVDEREEVFPQVNNTFCFPTGQHIDILSGCTKTQGIEMLLRNMGPDTIAVDEITAAEDCQAMIHAGWCGVKLLATAHASNVGELYHRPVYKPLIESNLFDTALVIGADKRWHTERIAK